MSLSLETEGSFLSYLLVEAISAIYFAVFTKLKSLRGVSGTVLFAFTYFAFSL